MSKILNLESIQKLATENEIGTFTKILPSESELPENIGANYLWFLIEGSLAISHYDPEGKQVILKQFLEGDLYFSATIFHNILSLISPRKIKIQPNDTVTTFITTQSKDVLLQGYCLQDIIRVIGTPNFQLELASVAFQRLQETTAQNHDLFTYSVAQRLAKKLLEMKNQANAIEGFTQEFIAFSIFIARETVTVVLAKMEKMGILQTDRKSIKIINEELLKKVAEGTVQVKYSTP